MSSNPLMMGNGWLELSAAGCRAAAQSLCVQAVGSDLNGLAAQFQWRERVRGVYTLLRAIQIDVLYLYFIFTRPTRIVSTLSFFYCVDEFGWPSPECAFPDWLSLVTWWRDVDGKHVYSANEEKRRQLLSVTRATPKRQLLSEHACLNEMTSQDPHTAVFRTFSTHNWFVAASTLYVSK